MKNKLMTLLLVLSSGLLTNCSKNSTSSSSATVGTCAAGQVYTTQYGCLQQTSYCTQTYGVNYGNYNGSCVAGTYSSGASTCSAGYVYTTQYNCLPQTAICTQQYGANYGSYNGTCVAGTYSNGTGTNYCPAGQVSTSKGCLPQNNCPAGLGYYYGYATYQGVNTLGEWCIN